ncbi:unnamed protein product [Rotaria sp. Silwood2]|nr:unnamed protein product [Rotaria sp. Silwood2]
MLINSKSNMTDDSNPTSSDTSANETMMVTESVTFVSTETYTITPLMACKLNVSNGFTVKVRTSSMFTALIIYNCSSINSSELFVFVNGLDANNCIVTEDISDNMNYTTVNVTCDNIMNNAGRDWTFNMGQKFSDSQTIFNEIFIVTLVPLSLNGSTSIDVTISEDLTSALIFIPNCTDICDVAYLMVHCNDSDLSNQTLLNSCTHTCSNIQPGSIYNFSLVRLPIRIVDKIEDEHDNEFQEEILYREYQTNLDKVSNFKFENDYHDNKTAWIYFNRPRGNFHKIYLNCSIQDQRCSNDRIILTNETDNCSNCNFITISPITRGVSYQCHAITIKENFLNVISDKFNFVTVFIVLPSWFRFAQCIRRYRDTKAKFPHLANAGKYASGFLVAITNAVRRATILEYQQQRTSNPFLYLWFISSLIGSTYKLIWDLKMDYGFFDKNAGKNKFLRDQIIYSSKAYYYAAIIENILFRFIWIINIFIYFNTSAAEYADIIGFVFGIIEAFRRFIWNYFRLENEHLNNCGEFRAVRDIPIQTTVTVASGYSTRLESIGSLSNLGDEQDAKRRQSMIRGGTMTAMERSRTLTILNEAFDNETSVSKSLTTGTNSNQAQNVSNNLESSSNTISSSNSLVLVNPYYTRTQPT